MYVCIISRVNCVFTTVGGAPRVAAVSLGLPEQFSDGLSLDLPIMKGREAEEQSRRNRRSSRGSDPTPTQRDYDALAASAVFRNDNRFQEDFAGRTRDDDETDALNASYGSDIFKLSIEGRPPPTPAPDDGVRLPPPPRLAPAVPDGARLPFSHALRPTEADALSVSQTLQIEAVKAAAAAPRRPFMGGLLGNSRW